MKILDSEFQAWMGGVQARMESVLARVLPAASVAPARLHEAMRYADARRRQARAPAARVRGRRSLRRRARAGGDRGRAVE